MINEFVKLENIAVNVKADCWKEAVRKAGQLLLSSDCIEERYIDAMIEKVTELGPYIVIAPQIAMPHARPEDGVKQTSIAIITLQNGVNFGHEKNDPVKLLIALAAIDSTAHIEALANLMDILGNEEKLNNILNSKTSKELYEFLF
ncbi:PTS sugar transporter subunit IIA [Alkaliphilus sp. MSJ-5]|uniref:PTS sugar transporter subunit IIA n=1 Tax=Alkaliphilus flagellatus TaxID=2841507 RepID=A0ABS6G006_9FIRM|nr:PTS sugar transporter subunit IIA [Alkaliphilus flagellatus]MBU5675835.1 PTS sugar transporter subunit IIA [Alkaliphilus flagellatus]